LSFDQEAFLMPAAGRLVIKDIIMLAAGLIVAPDAAGTLLKENKRRSGGPAKAVQPAAVPAQRA
jgi:hypothetical protein